MRTSLKVSRGLQLIGALLLITGIVGCMDATGGRTMGWTFLPGILLILGGRIYEWMAKE